MVWSKNKDKLTVEDDVYVINQVLMFGSLEEIGELKNKYGLERLRRVFVDQPLRVYSKPAFNLIKNFILKIGTDLDMGRYIKSVY